MIRLFKICTVFGLQGLIITTYESTFSQQNDPRSIESIQCSLSYHDGFRAIVKTYCIMNGFYLSVNIS